MHSISVTAPLVVVVGAFCYRLAASSFEIVSAQVGGTAFRLPTLVSTAISAVQIISRIVTKAIVKALPFFRAAG